MKKLLIFLLVYIPLTAFAISRSEAVELYKEGNALYEKGAYQEALGKYEAAISGYRSFELYFNAGNCCVKLNRIPEAVIHYERARKINPTDEDLLNNLSMANLKLVDKIEHLPALGVETWWMAITAEGTLGRWTALTIIFTVIAFALLGIFIWYRTLRLRKMLAALGIVCLLLAAGTWILASSAHRRIASNTEAIIKPERIDVRTSPSAEAVSSFVLHAGTKVVIRNVSGDWAEVKIANGNVGWMPFSDLVVI
ncbi:MAG: tetratricopeptide repeat protein [Flavobacteriales bacterium]|nr:tetratricopeptide repeat protein [Flavobacteriales bacterium]